MAISNYRTFVAGEVLTAANMNALQTHFTSNALTLISPLTAGLDCDGQTLTLDADADSTLRPSSDDVIVLRLQGLDAFIFDGDVASPVNGITFKSSATGVPPSIEAQGSDSNINLRLTPKGTGQPTLGSTDIEFLDNTYGANSSNQAITAATETDITALTALTLPNTAATLSSRKFLVMFSVSVSDTSAAANLVTLKLYSGANGTKADTPVHSVLHDLVASKNAAITGMIRFSPGGATATKVGLAITTAGNATVNGGLTVVSSIWIQEVQ